MAETELSALFDNAERELFRLETLPGYDAPHDAERARQFEAGALFPDPPQPTAWTNEIRSLVESGRRMPHVRLVTEPLTMYTRKSIEWFYPYHAEAGRGVHILSPRSPLADEAVKAGDYWMFDSSIVALMEYNEVGGFLGIKKVTGTDEVAYYTGLRDRLLAEAEPFQQWLAGWRQRTR